MSKLNVTPGEIFTDGKHIMLDNPKNSEVIAETFRADNNDADLYTDAHNTFNKCGKLPSELMEENKELIALAEMVKNWVRVYR